MSAIGSVGSSRRSISSQEEEEEDERTFQLLLYCNIASGKVERVIQVFKDKANWTEPSLLKTLFGFKAIQDARVQQVLKDKVNCIMFKGESLLVIALEEQALEVAKFFIEKGADVNFLSNKGHSPLSLAVHCSSNSELVLEIVRLLIEKGADVNMKTYPKKKPHHQPYHLLTAALLAEKEPLAKLLIESGANVNGNSCDGFNPLAFASSGITKCLLERGANADRRGVKNITALIIAVNTNDIEKAKLLIKYGATIDFIDDRGFSPLKLAATKGHKEMVELLLENGAYVDKIDEFWIKKLEDGEIIELLRKASKKNNMMIEKMEKIVFDEISKINEKREGDSSAENDPINEIPIEDIKNILKRFFQDEFDLRLYQFKQGEKEKEILEKINLIDKELQEVKGKNDVLYKIYEIREAELSVKRDEVNKLMFNSSVKTFYFAINALLEVKLVGMMLLLGHVIKREDTTGEKRGLGTLETLMALLDILPGGGAVGTGLTLLARDKVEKKIDKTKLKQAEQIREYLANREGAAKFAELVARKVAQKYRDYIISERIDKCQVRNTGEKVVELVFKVIIEEKHILALTESFIKKTLIEKIEEEHKKENLFGITETEAEASRSLHARVDEIADKQRADSERQELIESQNRKLKIKSLTEPAILLQFNTTIRVDFPPIADPDPLFEIVLNENYLSIILCEDTAPKYLYILNKYLPLFSKDVINDWEIKEEPESIEIKCRSTQTAKELKAFFQDSSLPVKMIG